MVSSEATPYAKSGGLADAVSALSRALGRAGHDTRIVLPRYYAVDRAGLEVLPGPIGVPTGHGQQWAVVYRGSLPASDIPVYFIDHEGFFGRDGLYGSRTETDFGDNPERFSFFSRAVFQLCRKLNWIPDVMHAHDWPSALVPVFLRYLEAHQDFKDTVSVLTIHNLGYQGVYPKQHFESFGLPWELFHGAGLEYHDAINLLKAGISCADRLSTVSPTYSREIQTPEQGCTLDGLLRARSASLVGILNGVDLHEWNPETDAFLPSHYSASDLSGKSACKVALQQEFGLKTDAHKPLIGMVTRLTDQKGIAELFSPGIGCVQTLCQDMDLQFAILGSGEAWCETELRTLTNRLPNLKARIGYSERLAHLIEAGADFFLMPSRYEPCGLNQMYSLRYGTLPIVRRTGGLADTVSNYDQENGNGTGFMFDSLTPRAIYDTVGWSVWAWYNRKDHIHAMQIRAMGREFSWDKSAAEYHALYDDALANNCMS
jgi:starch synthase